MPGPTREALLAENKRMARRIAELEEQIALSSSRAATPTDEQYAHFLIDSTPLGVFRVDLQLNLFYANAAFCTLAGRSLEELQGQGWRQAVHPADHAALRSEWSLNPSTPYTQRNFCYIRPDGEIRSTVLSIGAAVDAQGRPLEYFGVVVDVTEEKRLVQTLQQQSRALGERMKELRCLYNVTHLYDRPNLTIADLVREAAEAIPPAMTFVDLAGARVRLFDHEYCTPGFVEDGVAIAAPVMSGAELCGMVEASYPDTGAGGLQAAFLDEEQALLTAVAEHLGQATQRLHAEQALRTSEERLTLAIAAVQAGVWEWNAATGRTEWSDQVYTLLGYAVGSVVPSQQAWIDRIVPADRERVTAIFAQAWAAQSSADFEFAVAWDDGSMRQMRSVSQLNAESRDSRWVGLLIDVSELRAAQDELQQSEAQLRSIIESSLAVVVLTDERGDVLLVSNNVEAVLGFRPAQLVGRSFRELAHPDDAAEIVPIIGAVMATPGATATLTFRARRSDGSWRWMDARLTNQSNVSSLRGYVVSMVDVTERVQAEAALKELNAELDGRVSERTKELEQANGIIQAERDFLAQVMETMGQGLVVTDVTGMIEYSNPAYAALLGLPPSTLVGQPLVAAVLPADVDALHAAFADVMSGRSSRVELQVTGADGGVRCLMADMAPRRQAGQITGAIAGFADLTAIRAAEEGLRRSERRYRLLADHSSDVISLHDGEGRVTYISPAVSKMTGHDPEELIGSTMYDVMHPDDRILLQPQAAGAFSAPRRSEARIRCRDGRYIWIEAVSSPLHDPATGIFTGTIRSARDVTMRHEMEDALRERTAELSAANTALQKAARAKDDFLASMSHELRTPLTGILSFSEALTEGIYGPLTERQQRMVRGIEESGRHLLDLVNDILDLSKIEAGRMDLQFQSFNLDEVGRSGLSFVQQLVQSKRQRAAYKIEPTPLELWADPRRLKQMLINLLSNAAKFTPEGGDIGLEIAGDSVQRVVRIAVWDTGVGIAAEDLARIFQPFTQVDNTLTRQYAGSGLGLVLVERIASLHGGGIAVDSEPGRGSRFTVTIPWLTGPETAAGEALPLADAAAAAAVSVARLEGSPLALVVEDNEFTVLTLVDYLQTKGCRTAVAHNGYEALLRVQADRPDIVLMDIQMPGMDGMEAIRRIRGMPDALIAATPIIALTALAMAGDRERCLAAGADDYLSKPISLRNLISIMRVLLSRRPAPLTEAKSPA